MMQTVKRSHGFDAIVDMLNDDAHARSETCDNCGETTDSPIRTERYTKTDDGRSTKETFYYCSHDCLLAV